MKILHLAGALALACMLSACQTSGLDLTGGSLATSGTTTTASLTVDDPAVAAAASKAVSIVRTGCGLEASASALGAFALAGGYGLGAQVLADGFCHLFASATSGYAAETKAPQIAPPVKKGDVVQREVVLPNGKVVVIPAVVVDPKKAKAAGVGRAAGK